MKKEEFIKLMTEFVSIKEGMDAVNNAFRKLDPDFNFISLGRMETVFVKAMEIATNDEST